MALNSPGRVIDTHAEMLIARFVPMSNTERQRRFRERHPGYYGRLHRKHNAGNKAMLKQRWAEVRAKAQAQAHAQAELLAQAKAIVASFQRAPLMLPAPAPLHPLASKIAALAEARKARAAVVRVREA